MCRAEGKRGNLAGGRFGILPRTSRKFQMPSQRGHSPPIVAALRSRQGSQGGTEKAVLVRQAAWDQLSPWSIIHWTRRFRLFCPGTPQRNRNELGETTVNKTWRK